MGKICTKFFSATILITQAGVCSPSYDGFLQCVEICASPPIPGSGEKAVETRYRLDLIEPITMLFPDGELHSVSFMLFAPSHLPFEDFLESIVRVEGKIVETASPCCAHIPIFHPDRLTEIRSLRQFDEETISFCEELVPAKAVAACAFARWQALAAGHSVLEVEENWLIETSPDGTKKWIKPVVPPHLSKFAEEHAHLHFLDSE